MQDRMHQMYIYHNPAAGFQFQLMKYEDMAKETNNLVVSLCTSYLCAETHDNFKDLYSRNSSNMLQTAAVWSEINDLKSGAFHCGDSDAKYECARNISIIETDATHCPQLLHSQADREPILAASRLNGIVFGADYHEVTNALSLNVPFVFLIPKDELSRYNGPVNYRPAFLEKILRPLKEIKQKNADPQNY